MLFFYFISNNIRFRQNFEPILNNQDHIMQSKHENKQSGPNANQAASFRPSLASVINHSLLWFKTFKKFLWRKFILAIIRLKPAYNELYYDRVAPHIRSFWQNKEISLWVIALLIGIAVAGATLLFRLSIGALQWTWLGTTSEKVGSFYETTPAYVFFLAPLIGGIIVGQILHHFMPGNRAHGAADVIEAKAIKGSHVDLKTGIWSAIISVLSLGFGASAGREGPVVHLGATLSSLISRTSDISHAHRRILLASGVAAAVSASFNAPIAGVLFAHEVILAHYALSAFVPVVLASVAGTIITRLTIGQFPAFLIPEYSINSYFEFPAFALLGVVAALVSILFQLTLSTTERIAWNYKLPIWARPIIGGALIGTIALIFPEILGVGYDTTDNALKQNLSLTLLLSLLVAKTIATAITLASRFGGGVFSPSLYLGACAGGAFGLIAAHIAPEAASTNGLYAILGMGGVAAAILGAPISTALIVFELTGGYEMTIALLVTVSISTALSQAVLGMSFFHWQLSTRGLFLAAGPHKQIATTLTVDEFYRPLNPEHLEQLKLAGETEELTLTPDEDGKYPPHLQLSDNIEKTLRSFNQHGLPELPVIVDKTNLNIIGHTSQLSALKAYNNALIEAHEEEHK